MSVLFLVLLIVCIVGLVRPFKGLKRWHFGIAAIACFILIGLTAPKPEEAGPGHAKTAASELSQGEKEAIEKKNAASIADLKKQAGRLPSNDVAGQLSIYQRLSVLAPANVSYSEKVDSLQSQIEARKHYKDNPSDALKVVDFSWSAGGFGSIMIIDRLVVSNDAPFPIKDFTLHCVHQGHSGTDIDENTRTIFEIVPANGKKTLRNVNMGFIQSQVATSNCEITAAKIAD